jgi:hypothetical protein
MHPRRILMAIAVAALMAAIGIVQVPAVARAAVNSSGEIAVPLSALNALIGEPDRHFHQADALYIKGDQQGAASQIRAAAALIRMEAGRGNPKDAAKLRDTATSLDTLADNVIAGNVGSRRDLALAFARADLALASHYRSMATQALANKDRANAGRWLKAAGDSVDEAASWTGQSPSGAQAQMWDQMHALQAKIRTGANWSYGEAKKGVGYLGAQIQYLGKQMQNFGSPGSGSSGTAN